MKFKIKKQGFNSFLQVIRSIGKETNISLNLTGDSLVVKAMKADNTCYVDRVFKVDSYGNDGSFIVGYDEFIKRVKLLDAEFFIDLIENAEFNKEEGIFIDKGMLKMHSGNKKINIRAIEDNRKIGFPALEDSESIQIKKDKLIRSIEKVSNFVSIDPLRAVLQAVYFKFSNNVLTTVSSDSVILSEFELEIDGNYSNEFLIMADHLKIIQSLFPDDEDIHMLLEKDYISFVNDDTKYMVRCIIGKFPKYGAVFPKETGYELKCSTRELLVAVKAAGLASPTNTQRIDFIVKDNVLEVVGTGEGYKGVISEKIPCISEDIELSFNHRKLETVLNNCEDEEVTLEILTPLKPVVVKEDGLRLMVMPIAK